ncbi:MAG: hypothetical protein AABX88_00080 [Nanoarchaeota archaeon]
MYPKKLKELVKKKQLPTQLYISVNSPNKKMFDKFHRSTEKNAWKKLNESLDIMSRITPQGCTPKISKENFTIGRTVFRMNLVKDLNMNFEHAKEYAKLIKKATPMFVEIKGFMSVGFARQRLGYERMPTHEEIKKFANELLKELNNLGIKMKILDEHYYSRAIVLGKDKKELKIEGI